MHITTLTRAIFTLIFITLSGELLAQTVIEQLKSLSEQHQYGAMYELASQNREQYEGDPDFDFYYGVAAVDTNHVNEGVFALERVVFTQPKNHLARLELARGYYLQGDDVRSRQEFEKVLKVKPPASVVKVVDKYMAAIRIRESQYKTSSSAYIDIEIGGDSNVNAGPERNTLGIFENVLSTGNFENNDSYATYSFGGKLNHPVSPHRTLFLNADASFRRNSNETVNDNGQITLQGGTQWQKVETKYRLSLVGQQYTLDGRTNRNMFGVGFEGIYSTSKLQQLTLSVNLMDMQYPDSPVYDSNQLTVGLSSFTKGEQVSWYGGANTGVQASKERTETAKSGADRLILGGNIGSLISIDSKSNINLHYVMDLSKYSGVHSATTPIGSTDKREDIYSKLSLTYNRIINDQWKYRAGINYSQNSSNVALLSYKRNQLFVGFQRVF